MDGTSADAGHRNIFLSSDAAVPAPPTRRSIRIPAVALRLARRANAARRRIADVRLLRPEFSLPRARTAGVLGLVAACAVAVAALALAWQPSSSPRSRSVHQADAVFGLDRLKERLLLSAESASAVVSTKTQPHTVTRTAGRHSVTRVRHVRRRATRIASVPAVSKAKSASEPTHTTSGAAAVTSSASRLSSTSAVSETPTQQTPTQQTHQQQQVHYQPPSQPAGPAGLGSQVGGDCNPKCS